MSFPQLELERHSFYELVINHGYQGTPSDLTGLMEDADFTITEGEEVLWTTDLSGDIQAELGVGKFTVLIPEEVVDSFTFTQAKYRFRLKWASKGWQSLVDGKVVFSD